MKPYHHNKVINGWPSGHHGGSRHNHHHLLDQNLNFRNNGCLKKYSDGDDDGNNKNNAINETNGKQ